MLYLRSSFDMYILEVHKPQIIPLFYRTITSKLWQAASSQSQINEDCVTGIDQEGHNQVIIMDMGQHAIQDSPEPKQLYQVLVPGLEDRARLCPEIMTYEQITTGDLTAN